MDRKQLATAAEKKKWHGNRERRSMRQNTNTFCPKCRQTHFLRVSFGEFGQFHRGMGIRFNQHAQTRTHTRTRSCRTMGQYFVRMEARNRPTQKHEIFLRLRIWT